MFPIGLDYEQRSTAFYIFRPTHRFDFNLLLRVFHDQRQSEPNGTKSMTIINQCTLWLIQWAERIAVACDAPYKCPCFCPLKDYFAFYFQLWLLCENLRFKRRVVVNPRNCYLDNRNLTYICLPVICTGTNGKIWKANTSCWESNKIFIWTVVAFFQFCKEFSKRNGNNQNCLWAKYIQQIVLPDIITPMIVIIVIFITNQIIFWDPLYVRPVRNKTVLTVLISENLWTTRKAP